MTVKAMRDYSEKRDFIRMQIDAEVTLRDEKSGRTMTGICRDLSGTGMLLEVEEPVPVDRELQTSLPSSNQSFDDFDTRVRVLRCDAQDQGKYILGVVMIRS